MEKGTLYIVATPIGNLEDMTFRAVRILKEVDTIFCEDTRTTRVLLSKYDIHTRTSSYHVHSTKGKENAIIAMLEEGRDVALVSDAGTPCISDPGVMLVGQVRESFGAEARIVPIPGASALISAVSASGISMPDFIFLGFLPHKKGRETLFKEIATGDRAYVFYESSHRIMKTLESLAKTLDEGRIVMVCRELTKTFEQFVKGNPNETLEYFTNNPDRVRGEFVVIVARS